MSTTANSTQTSTTSSGITHILMMSLVPENETVYLNTTVDPTAGNHTVSSSDGGPSRATEIAVGIVIGLTFLVLAVIVLFCILKRMGTLPAYLYRAQRKRRSSTSSSRRALDEESCDTNSLHRPNEKLKQTTEEMFTIDDFEEEEDAGEDRERDEYFYDEVFGQSGFEDQGTQNSVRQLYSADSGHPDSHGLDDEMLDFDFETLGIKIDSYAMEATGKVNV